jgi:hypothetical protein
MRSIFGIAGGSLDYREKTASAALRAMRLLLLDGAFSRLCSRVKLGTRRVAGRKATIYLSPYCCGFRNVPPIPEPMERGCNSSVRQEEPTT